MTARINAVLKRRNVIRRLAEVWLLLVVVGSLQPTRLFVAAKSLRIGNPEFTGSWQAGTPIPALELHREIHWLAFGGVAFLLLLLTRSRREEICSAFAAGLLGMFLEFLQHLIYHIPMEWLDVRQDVLAIVAIFALYQIAGAARSAIRAPGSA